MIKKYTTELSELLASKHNLQKKEAREFVTAFIETINEGLEKDGVVRIKGLGYFKITTIKPRKSVNVSTGESVIIESHKKVNFTPDPAIKELVNKPFFVFMSLHSVRLLMMKECHNSRMSKVLHNTIYHFDH